MNRKKSTLKEQIVREHVDISILFFLTLSQKNKFYFHLNFVRIIPSNLFIGFKSSAFLRKFKIINLSCEHCLPLRGLSCRVSMRYSD